MIFFIGHYLGLIEIVTDEIKEFFENGVSTYENDTIDADIIIKCTGFERNSKVSNHTSFRPLIVR